MPETMIPAATDGDPVADLPPETIPEGRPRLLHMKCPQGHRLEAPCTLDGQDVVCPYCSERFPFTYRDSDEFGQDSRQVSKPLGDTAGHGQARWQEWFLVALVMAGAGAAVHQALVRWM